MNWADQRYAIGRGLAAIRHKTNLECQPFIRALVETGLRSLLASATGSTFPSVSRMQIESIRCPRLSLEEQKRIAHILGTLDEKIELNRRMNATLEGIARALFKSWFIDFDPVHAKAAGKEPAGMNKATADLFPDSFEDSELGEIPKGWEASPVGELCEVNGWTLSKSDSLEVIEYIEISEVSKGDVLTTSTYSRGAEPSRARRRMRHGDTVLSTVRPDRGAYFLALDPPNNRLASTGFAVFTPTKAPWAFIFCSLTTPEAFAEFGRLADGGAYPAIRPEQIGSWPAIVPNSMGVLEAFQRKCGPLLQHSDANRRQSRSLAAVRDALLPRLLTAELFLGKVD